MSVLGGFELNLRKTAKPLLGHFLQLLDQATFKEVLYLSKTMLLVLKIDMTSHACPTL